MSWKVTVKWLNTNYDREYKTPAVLVQSSSIYKTAIKYISYFIQELRIKNLKSNIVPWFGFQRSLWIQLVLKFLGFLRQNRFSYKIFKLIKDFLWDCYATLISKWHINKEVDYTWHMTTSFHVWSDIMECNSQRFNWYSSQVSRLSCLYEGEIVH